MPPFDANADITQELGTLGKSLFPDPSAVAHSYYYGSKAREAQLTAAKQQDALAQSHLGTMLLQRGGDFSAGYTPGFGGTMITTDPNAPGAVLRPSVNTPVQGPTPAGPGAAPPGPGSALTNTIMPVLSSPTATQNALTTGVSALSTGIPQQGSASTAEASATPTPTATGSNGTDVPTTGNGLMHPASVNSGGGGVIQAGPASHDGSLPLSSLNMPMIMNRLMQGGMDFNSAKALMLGTIGNQVKNGTISQPVGEQLAAFFGEPTMRNQALTNQGLAARTAAEVVGRQQVANTEVAGRKETTGMEVAGREKTTNITQQAETQRKLSEMIFIADEGNPTKGTYYRLGDLQNLGGPPGTPPPAGTPGPAPGTPGAPATGAAATVIPPRGGGLRTASPVTANTMAAPIQTLPQGPGMPPVTQPAYLGYGQQHYDPSQTPKPLDATEVGKRQFLIDRTLSQQFPVPTDLAPLSQAIVGGRNTSPAGASPELNIALQNLTDEYFRIGPTGVKGDIGASANAAYTQMAKEGYINPTQSRERGFTGDTYTSRPTYNKAGVPGDAKAHFRIDMIDPKTGKPFSPGTQPTDLHVPPELRTVMPAPPAGSTPPITPGPVSPGVTTVQAYPPGTVLGPAVDANGKPVGEGQAGTWHGGKIIAHNGQWVAQ